MFGQKMKPMPKSISDLQRQAVSIGLAGPKPERALETPEGKLISYCYNSWKIRRSFNHVSMILLGNSGVGKSATINHLLGVNIAKTSEDQSETRQTTEYIVKADNTELRVKNMTLGIIDTPGMNDTDGVEQDACNLMSILRFTKESENLNKCFPNVVMIVVQSTDTRILGKKSKFQKTLFALHTLNLVDQKNPNVIVVISWAKSVSFDSTDEWKETLKNKSEKLKDMVKATLFVDPPVVWIENKNEKMPKTKDNQQTILPDGTYQPNNLFLALTGLLQKSGDSLGVAALKLFFSLSLESKKKAEVGLCIDAKIAEDEVLSSKEMEILNTLKKKDVEGEKLPEVVLKIRDYIKQIDSKLTQDNKSEAEQIADVLVIKLGMTKVEHVKTHSVSSLKTLLGIDMSDFGKILLSAVFSLEDETFLPDTFMCVGKGYNILLDTPKNFDLIKFDDLTPTDFGFKIPKGMKLTKTTQSETFMSHFDNEEKYIENRLAQLNISGKVETGIFNMTAKAGFSRTSSNTSSSTTTGHSYLLEKRFYQIEITDTSLLKLSESFKKAVNQLPSSYEKHNPKNRNEFQDFFNNWGFYVICSAYVGGSLEVKSKSMSSSNEATSIYEIEAEITSFFRNLEGGFKDSHGEGSTAKSSSKLSASHLKWSGGDTKYQFLDLSQATSESWNLWLSSLAKSPATLTTKMSLTPIHEFIKLAAESKVEASREALIELLGGKFQQYVSKEEEAQKQKEEELRLQQESDRKKLAASVQVTPPKESCFPGDSLVFIKHKKYPISIEKLSIGDEVLAWNNLTKTVEYSTVFMFGHRNCEEQAKYIKIVTDNGAAICISPKHMIMIKDKKSSPMKVTFAEQVTIGDTIFKLTPQQEVGFPQEHNVKSLETVTMKGFYAPFTLLGTIIVDGTLASCYANVPNLSVLGSLELSGQNLAHAGLAPLRRLHHMGLRKMLEIPEDQTMSKSVTWMTKIMKPFLSN